MERQIGVRDYIAYPLLLALFLSDAMQDFQRLLEPGIEEKQSSFQDVQES